MARLADVLTGPASSTGSPTTLMMRPSVSSPTGTEIGCPVSVTSWPRTRPSLMSIAMVRTVDSPRCCATSSTRRLPPFVVSSAFKIAGSSPSNCTSTTAPMTWVIFPTALVGVAIDLPLAKVSQRLGAGDDLDQLFGDHRLTGAVVGQRLLADHFAGVAGGVVHGAHLGAIERCGVLKQRAEDLHRDIARQELCENLLLVRLILVDSRGLLAGCGFEHWRNDLLGGRDLGDHRFEAREEQRADIELPLRIERGHLLGDRFSVDEADGAHRPQLDVFDDVALVLAAQLLVALLADAEDLDLLAVSQKPVGVLAREPHDRRVERAAQTALGCAHEQEMHPVAAGAAQ